MEFLKRHPKAFVGFIAVEIILLAIVGTTLFARAQNNSQLEALCNGSALTASSTPSCRGSDRWSVGGQPPVSGNYSAYDNKYLSNTSGNSNPSTAASSNHVYEYPFDKNGNQMVVWNNNGQSATSSGSNSTTNNNKSTNTTSNTQANATTNNTATNWGNGVVPRSPNHQYQYPFNADGTQVGTQQAQQSTNK